MSFACLVMVILLGSSAVAAFVLQPPRKESGGSVISTGSHQSCFSEPLQSIRKSLLESLNLQTEPQVPVGLLDSVREQWRNAFSVLSYQTSAGEAHDAPVFDGGHINNSLKCCSMTAEIFMKDLGWDNWVIYPNSLTITKCTLCTKEGTTVHCSSPHAPLQSGQAPCCHSTSQKMVPIIYMDEFGSVVIASVQLTQGCGCDTGNTQPPSNK